MSVCVCKGVSVCIYECVSVHRQELCSDFSPCYTLFTSAEKVIRGKSSRHFTAFYISINKQDICTEQYYSVCTRQVLK